MNKPDYTEEQLDHIKTEFCYSAADGVLRRVRSMKPAGLERRRNFVVVYAYRRPMRIHARNLVVFLMTGSWPEPRSYVWKSDDQLDLRWSCFTLYNKSVEKPCAKCERIRPLTEFHSNTQQATGRHSYCVECIQERNRIHGVTYRERYVYSKFKLAPDLYRELYEKQNHCCAICKKPEDYGSKRLAVDHCHTTGVVRGLLCMGCNTAIGMMQDRPKRLLAAALYLLAARE